MTGEPPPWLAIQAASLGFQSAPVIDDGRASIRRSVAPGFISFQSAPVIDDGRAEVAAWYATQEQVFQSAPVIDDGRATKPTLRTA